MWCSTGVQSVVGRKSICWREVTTLSVDSRKKLLEKAGITLTIPEQQGITM
jgi:hypothetical protein